jgi:Holliday junction DNA helicase RuvA
MLDHIKGQIVEKKAGQAVIEAGGLGFLVKMAIPAYLALPEPPGIATILTRLIIREESWEIFGFLKPAEREAFDILTSVSRVGPRLALTILSSLEPYELAQILIDQDLASLSSIKGIGAKTAERLLVELKDKALRLASVSASSSDKPLAKRTLVQDEAVLALVNLGYGRSEAEKAVRSVAAKAEDDLGAVIKAALKSLNV